jgi:hypothetical protein
MITFTTETADIRRSTIQEQLREQVCVVTFTKVDGSQREMPCTLKESLLPVSTATGTKTKKPNPEVMSVFCTDKQEWRSFRLENVINIRPQE